MPKIIRKTYKPFKGTVYDLTVANTHSYNVEGLAVHNCGGSLVAYLMGITEIDPIRFDLIFERFINPERLDLPDADLDFQSTRRGEIIEYLKSRFGEASIL